MKAQPRIEQIDAGLVHLAAKVAVPRRFRATFDDIWATTIEVDATSGRPAVREVVIALPDGNLAEHDLRVPLRGRLLPAAIAAASVSLLFGPEPNPAQELVEFTPSAGEVGVIGPIRAYGRADRDRSDYARAGSAARARRPGRPRREPDIEELQAIVATYLEGGRSVAAIRARHPMSAKTAYRRLREAADLDLLEADASRKEP